MRVWMGWTATSARTADGVPTWEEWCARIQRGSSQAKRQQEGSLFSEHEVARLSFVRWLRQRADPDSQVFGQEGHLEGSAHANTDLIH